MRQGGVLLHITSLPSRGGIGTLGAEAYAFVDFLRKSGMRIWQVLPVGPTGYGESPYQSASSFAGNPLLIDIPSLAEEGLLAPEEAASMPQPENPERVDFDVVRSAKDALLRKAYSRFSGSLDAFRKENPWVEDYAMFAALKRHFHGVSWMAWPDESVRMRDGAALARYGALLRQEIEYEIFVQMLFRRQWTALKKYANEQGIRIFGDMPIYSAEDSCDVWTHPDCFQLDARLHPVRVAGVPPDYFSEDGQLWGNPLYDWKTLKARKYDWWVERMRAMAELFDMVRIDHFIGFAHYYSIPAGAPNAREGCWMRGPGKALFRVLREKAPQARIVAEDLGCLTGTVIRLRNACGYPGMKVLEFCFGGKDNPLSPKNMRRNCVAYTGTHDNDTVVGWWRELDENTRANVQRILHVAEDGIAQAMVRAAFSSPADTAIAPMQDILSLDDARMNVPGTIGGNWLWRMQPGACTEELAKRLRKMNHETGREALV